LTLEEELKKAGEAKLLLEHPLIAEAFSAIKKQMVDAWETSAVRDTEGRERLFMAVKILVQLEGFLREFVVTGKLAAMQIEALKKGSSDELH
jgi:hypothetical protein